MRALRVRGFPRAFALFLCTGTGHYYTGDDLHIAPARSSQVDTSFLRG